MTNKYFTFEEFKTKKQLRAEHKAAWNELHTLYTNQLARIRNSHSLPKLDPTQERAETLRIIELRKVLGFNDEMMDKMHGG